MGVFNFFRKKTLDSEENKTQILNLTVATRHLEILSDSMNIFQKTTVPETFFSRSVHEDRELRGGGLGTCTHGLERTQSSHITIQKEAQERLLGVEGGGMEVSVYLFLFFGHGAWLSGS